MNPHIKIRVMRKKDLKPLSYIYANAYKRADVGENWSLNAAKQLLLYWLKRQPDLAIVAEYDTRLVGAFVAGIKPWWDGNHLVDGEIFVDPDYQKKGIGNELSEALYRIAAEKYDAKIVDFCTFRRKEFPLQWYKSQGFTVNRDLLMISGKIEKVLKKPKRNIDRWKN